VAPSALPRSTTKPRTGITRNIPARTSECNGQAVRTARRTRPGRRGRRRVHLDRTEAGIWRPVTAPHRCVWRIAMTMRWSKAMPSALSSPQPRSRIGAPGAELGAGSVSNTSPLAGASPRPDQGLPAHPLSYRPRSTVSQTSVLDVLRHRKRAPGRIRTFAHGSGNRGSFP
jgi:hypothetical protein